MLKSEPAMIRSLFLRDRKQGDFSGSLSLVKKELLFLLYVFLAIYKPYLYYQPLVEYPIRWRTFKSRIWRPNRNRSSMQVAVAILFNLVEIESRCQDKMDGKRFWKLLLSLIEYIIVLYTYVRPYCLLSQLKGVLEMQFGVKEVYSVFARSMNIKWNIA